MLRLSIIVPFYNVEPYIEECIRSLYNQDIPTEEYEVICIDDCSLDGSHAIVERLQKEYPTLKLLRTPENLRQGGARNMGLNVAQGKYIWFVDSDDYIEENCIGTLLGIMDTESLEVLHFDYKELIPGKIYPDSREDINETICEGEDYFCDTTRAFWGTRCAEVWRRIHLRSLLIKNNLLFVENKRYEDTDFSIRLFHCVKKMKHVNCSPYIYRKNDVSTTHEHRSPELLIDSIQLLIRCLDAASQYNKAEAKNDVEHYVRCNATALRAHIAQFKFREKVMFVSKMLYVSLKKLYPHISFKTWAAFKLGINL